MTGGDAANVGRQARDRNWLVGVGAQPDWATGEAERTLRSVPEAHHCGFDGHPSAAQPDQEARLVYVVFADES